MDLTEELLICAEDAERYSKLNADIYSSCDVYASAMRSAAAEIKRLRNLLNAQEQGYPVHDSMGIGDLQRGDRIFAHPPVEVPTFCPNGCRQWVSLPVGEDGKPISKNSPFVESYPAAAFCKLCGAKKLIGNENLPMETEQKS